MENMGIPEGILVILIILAFGFILNQINPKLDWNYETGERLLWYNDPFDVYSRKSIILWKIKI